jgi:hypothetical protein
MWRALQSGTLKTDRDHRDGENNGHTCKHEACKSLLKLNALPSTRASMMVISTVVINACAGIGRSSLPSRGRRG